MLGILTDSEMNDLLQKQYVVRIGCSANGITYIVPINYVFEGNTIYGHSTNGQKIDMIRQNPEICFQIDDIDDFTHWKSVIAWGRFEEITDMAEQEKIMTKLVSRLHPFLTTNQALFPSHGFANDYSEIGFEHELIIYKITINKKTGRYEKR